MSEAFSLRRRDAEMPQLSTNILRFIISKNELFGIILPYSSDFCLKLRNKNLLPSLHPSPTKKNLLWNDTQAPPADFPTALPL